MAQWWVSPQQAGQTAMDGAMDAAQPSPIVVERSKGVVVGGEGGGGSVHPHPFLPWAERVGKGEVDRMVANCEPGNPHRRPGYRPRRGIVPQYNRPADNPDDDGGCLARCEGVKGKARSEWGGLS